MLCNLNIEKPVTAMLLIYLVNIWLKFLSLCFRGWSSKEKTLAFKDELLRTLKVIQRFDNHFSCHLQGEYVDWRFWMPYMGHALGCEWDMTYVIGGA
jgi:hypothetical protein